MNFSELSRQMHYSATLLETYIGPGISTGTFYKAFEVSVWQI